LEKVAIARGYLIPRQIRENGLREEEFVITDEAVAQVIRHHTREAGVRNLERELGSLCRKVATQIADEKIKKVKIDVGELVDYLGKPKFYGIAEIEERTAMAGVAAGLAWTPAGGDVLFIEATAMKGGKNFQLTGSLGEVMQESARAALSYVRSVSDKLDIDPEFWNTHDIHLHIPAGAQPKDGPSAGVTMAVTLASMATGRPVKCEVGMTGEITLRGKVLPIGGVKEKILAAHRAHMEKVILPRRNEVDLEEVPEDVRKNMEFIFADTVEDVINAALKPKPRKKTRKAPAKRSTGATKRKSTTRKRSSTKSTGGKKDKHGIHS
jgi:ATP-dependent Lon protease